MNQRDAENVVALYSQVTKQLLSTIEQPTFLYLPEGGEPEILQFPKPEELPIVESKLSSLGASSLYLSRFHQLHRFVRGLPRNKNGVLFPRRAKELFSLFLLENCREALEVPELR